MSLTRDAWERGLFNWRALNANEEEKTSGLVAVLKQPADSERYKTGLDRILRHAGYDTAVIDPTITGDERIVFCSGPYDSHLADEIKGYMEKMKELCTIFEFVDPIACRPHYGWVRDTLRRYGLTPEKNQETDRKRTGR